MQKFVPRSRGGFFLNECTGSTTLDPKACFGAFRSVWVHLGSFRYFMKLGAKQAELEVYKMNEYLKKFDTIRFIAT